MFVTAPPIIPLSCKSAMQCSGIPNTSSSTSSVFAPSTGAAFIGKFSIISSYSGGDAHRFISAFRCQLEYMGTNVLARSISVSKNKPLDTESAKRILQGLIDIIN